MLRRTPSAAASGTPGDSVSYSHAERLTAHDCALRDSSDHLSSTPTSSSTPASSSTSSTSSESSVSTAVTSRSRATEAVSCGPLPPYLQPLEPSVVQHSSVQTPVLGDEDDEDAAQNRLFIFRKMAFTMSLTFMILIAIWAPTMHYDIGYWAVVGGFIYLSLDLQTSLNEYFVIMTHPAAFVLACVGAVVGCFVVYYHPHLIDQRAHDDTLDPLIGWILHAAIYWYPIFILALDLYVGRHVLRKLYFLHLTWPLHDKRTRRTILWIFAIAPIVLTVWNASDSGIKQVYQSSAMDTPRLWAVIGISCLLASTALTYLVRFTSDYYLLPNNPIVVLK